MKVKIIFPVLTLVLALRVVPTRSQVPEFIPWGPSGTCSLSKTFTLSWLCPCWASGCPIACLGPETSPGSSTLQGSLCSVGLRVEFSSQPSTHPLVDILVNIAPTPQCPPICYLHEPNAIKDLQEAISRDSPHFPYVESILDTLFIGLNNHD